MKKVTHVLKNIRSGFEKYRAQNIQKYYEQIKISFIDSGFESLGKFLLLSLYAVTMIYYWNPSDKGFSLEGVGIVTACMTTGIITMCSMIMVVLLEFIKCIKPNHSIIKVLKWLDKRFLIILSEELNNNIVGLIIGNIIYIAVIFYDHWSEVLKLWNDNHMTIIHYFGMFFIFGVISPLALNWFNFLLKNIRIIISN
ncbi:MAG: hypothetical protein QG673_1530 [Pseudomonadota bacterium]|jgi:hypothetical protein|nr:hypothetical protein [Burkholderiales bacterium]MDQ5921472.1 hypothetical protein [Pseudomonadota bacterium]